MKILENVDLAPYSTMRLGGKARYFCELNSKEDLAEAAQWADENNQVLRVIGGGSNIVFKDGDFEGLLAVNQINFDPEVDESDNAMVIKFAGGMNWDDAVEFAVDKELSGIEALSLIPGTVGAAPVQNIGAYGQQLSEVFQELEAYDIENSKFTTLKSSACNFGYRTSIFKDIETQRYVITSLTLELSKSPTLEQPLYKDIEQYFEDNKVTEVSPRSVRTAVIAIRSAKLPDIRKTANTGSFFANPVITKPEFEVMASLHPQINQIPPGWPQAPRWFVDDGLVKLSAAWLIEQAGFGDFHDEDTGMATWPKQSLVLINEAAKSPSDLFAFSGRIVETVKEKFGITLKQEPETI